MTTKLADITVLKNHLDSELYILRQCDQFVRLDFWESKHKQYNFKPKRHDLIENFWDSHESDSRISLKGDFSYRTNYNVCINQDNTRNF